MTVGSSFLAEDIAELSVLFVKYVRVFMVRFINAQFLLCHFVTFMHPVHSLLTNSQR